jgi:hypothetical protein
MRKRQRKKNFEKARDAALRWLDPQAVTMMRHGNDVFVTRRLDAPVRIISCNCKFSFDISNSASDGTGED